MAAEAKLEREVRLYAEKRGVITYKFVSPAHRGVPDRIFIAPGGKILFLEFKAEGKKPSPLQAREIKRLRDQGVDVRWTSNFFSAIWSIDQLLS